MTPFDPRLSVIAAAARVKTCHVYHCFQAWRQMGQLFSAPHFAQFAGLEERHVSAILAALESHGAVPKTKARASTGTRLAPDFKMPAEWIDWAIAERQWTPDDTQAEAANFCDFWHSKPGAGAVKLDWRATWRNWVRNSNRPNGDYFPQSGVIVDPDVQAASRADFYDRIGRHTEAEDIRRRLAEKSNVVPFNSPVQKSA